MTRRPHDTHDKAMYAQGRMNGRNGMYADKTMPEWTGRDEMNYRQGWRQGFYNEGGQAAQAARDERRRFNLPVTLPDFAAA